MKSLGIHLWVGFILLVSCGFSLIDGSLVADPPIVLLAAITGAGLLICEFSLGGHRPRQPQPAPVRITGNARN
jgi:hypothetical protein